MASLESDSKVALDNENLKALQDHLKSLPVSSLKVGHHNEPKSSESHKQRTDTLTTAFVHKNSTSAL